MPKLKKLGDSILNANGNMDDIQKDIHAAYDGLNKEEMEKLLLNHSGQKERIHQTLNDIMLSSEDDENIKSFDNVEKESIEHHDILNFHKYLKTNDGKWLSTQPELYAYDPSQTSFDKNKTSLYSYQKKFIEDWAVSAQELVILYYGVGSGKTMVAVHCAEQYQEIVKDAHVYFIVPASLVIGTITEMYSKGIDAKRKNSKGEYIYYFISYQQIVNSDFEFKENSLLIIDEAHNMRNIVSTELSSVANSARWPETGDFSLVGNKLAQKLIMNKHKIVRTIMMTGTLFVNDISDIDALISIGYKKPPLLELDKTTLEYINNANDKLFKIYYEGLIAFYRLSETDIRFPKKNFDIIDIPSEDVRLESGEDHYYQTSRTQGTEEKMKWLFKFLEEKREERTLIYSQFKSSKIKPILKKLLESGFRVGYISGELDQIEKVKVVSQYNTGEINVLIFTLSIKEGISFKETNNIIIIEPYWNYAIMEQIIARGIRANSHAKGQGSTIYIYFLIATVPNSHSATKKWFHISKKIMNEDIKTFKFPTNVEVIKNTNSLSSSTAEEQALKTLLKNSFAIAQNWVAKKYNIRLPNTSLVYIKQLGPHAFFYESRDMYMFNLMITKQEKINIFEEKILKLDRFEKIQNNENSAYIAAFKKALHNYTEKHGGKLPSLKEERILRTLAFEKYSTQKEVTNYSKFHYLSIKQKEIDLDKRENIKILCPFIEKGVNYFFNAVRKMPNYMNCMIDIVVDETGSIPKSIPGNVHVYDSNAYEFINKYNYDYIFLDITKSQYYLNEIHKKKIVKGTDEHTLYLT